MAIKKRNLDDSLIQWIRAQTGLPLGVGNIYWVAATAAWRQFLMDEGFADTIYSNPKTAFDACTASRNDVVVVFPGTYDPGDVWTWNKDYTHMIGVGPVSMTAKPVRISHTLDSTETTGQFKISADGCMFKNVAFSHSGVAQSVYNVYITGSKLTFDHCEFLNMNDSTLADEAGMKGVGIIGGTDIVFRSCVIGGTETERTDGAADLTLDSGSDRLFFYDCLWVADLSADADDDHAFVETVDNAALSTFMYLDRCSFLNAGAAASVPDAFTIQTDLAGEILMRKPVVAAITDIADNEEKVWVTNDGQDSNPGKFAGIAIQPDVT